MARRKDGYLDTEARRIGFQKMLSDIERLLQSDLSEPQQIALMDQRNKIKEKLATS